MFLLGKGVSNIGPTKLAAFFQKNVDTGNLFGLLVEFICKKETVDAEFLQTLLSALLHEPCIAHDHVGPFYICVTLLYIFRNIYLNLQINQTVLLMEL